MRTVTGILIIAAALVTRLGCGAEHPLDEAARALSRGDLDLAATIYRRANAEAPTTEGYNNLGVALERAGKFGHALVAYRAAMEIGGGQAPISPNLVRIRIRAAIASCSPFAATAFFGIVIVSVVVWLATLIARACRHAERRTHLQAVRLLSLDHCVRCREGSDQPDGNAYPDSECHGARRTGHVRAR
jgi:tetratricopeptide (TPR) repeat protein